MTYQPVFPAEQQSAASALLRTLSIAGFHTSPDGFTVLLRGEQVEIPYRVYCPPHTLRSVVEGSSGNVQLLARCLGTRHHDGHVREECLRQIVSVDKPWVAPFVVQLLGEYVVEILEVIAAGIPQLNAVHYAGFARENPAFFALTKQRVRSYWDCYHRGRYPSFERYPGFNALEAIKQMAGAV